MKKSLLQAVALSSTLLLSGSALAEFSANIGATSNYLWRGVTQTDDAVAVQGGLDYAHESGFYAGTWASNVDFGSPDEEEMLDGIETYGTYETDFYAGYGGEFGEDFYYDISYIYYAYPDSDYDLNFGEVTLLVGWQWLEVGYTQVVNADDDVSGADDETDWSYVQANLSFPLTEKVNLGLHYGYSMGDVADDLYGDSYSDYNISLSADTDVGTVSFMVSKTDLDNDVWGKDDAKVVVGYVYNFDL
ncbi:TorF family putative porin [Shewanella subflava]|uniref:TorF family putative porin n=1 Tax=Shewanella subflava TaxID=2986476 RepID=A0ABT3IB84_9GAMM|nr:TorF family putative porin [Shewanella subflava]MCW3173306.1 TorF family putative porin [Shewanella subflava]